MKKFLLATILTGLTFCSAAVAAVDGLSTDADSVAAEAAGVTDLKVSYKEVANAPLAKELASPLGLKRNFSSISSAQSSYTWADQSDALPEFQPSAPADIQHHIDRAASLYQQVVDEQRFAEMLDASALVDLPIGIVGQNSETGETDYAILIDSLNITPTDAYLVVYMSIPIPQSDQRLTFMGRNIRFTKKGGLTGDVRLQLLQDVGFNLPGDNMRITIKGGEKTYAEWDCSGFKSMSIEGEALFSRNWLLPANDNSGDDAQDDLSTEGKSRVKGHFNISGVTHWNDLVTSVSIDPFRIRGLEDFNISVTNAVFDFSDFHNAPNIVFPQDYQSPQFIGSDRSAWRGFYLQQMTVTLPEEFKKKGDNKRLQFIAKDLLIDNMGISGGMAVKNLMTLDEGDLEGWAFSLDSLGIGLNASTIESAAFKGDIIMPVGERSKPFGYTAIINPDDQYIFNVQNKDTLNFSIWKARVTLHPNSELEIESINGDWKPKAVLHGNMNISDKSQDVNLANIDFEGLSISTTRPYVDVQSFSFSSDYMNNYQAFPIGLEEISFKKLNEKKSALEIMVRVKLSDAGFVGDAKLQVLSALQTVDGYDRWKYEKTKLSEVGIEIDQGSYYIKGWLAVFEDDPEYGKGFQGNVEMRFEPGFELSGTALFGKVKGFRYWYSDGFVSLPTGIPFYPPLAFYGFGGGMYSNMSQHGMDNSTRQYVGKTQSGLVYKPDRSIKYGLKATVQVGLISSKETFNADATFEIAFRDSGGISRISLTGNAYLMADQYFSENTMYEQLAELGEEAAEATGSGLKEGRGMIRAHLYTYFDFDNDVLHGELEMYVNVLGGALQGTGPAGRAGRAVAHFDHSDWYILIGTPDDRVGLSVLKIFKMDSYIMTGKNLPGSPPPPPMMRSIMSQYDLDYMRDLNALESGVGFAFGASTEFDTGDITFLVFYARLAAGAGFDIMMKDYGTARCKGSNSEIGVNGWYANGQAWTYVHGEVGIKFKIFGKRKKKTIFSGSGAMLMQTRLPNPFWMRGAFHIRYRILGGLIKGSVDFEVEIGDKCEVVGGSVVEGLSVISAVTPMEGSQDVDVFVAPQAVFNIPVNKEFEMLDVDDIKKTFRIKLDHFRVLDGQNEIPGRFEWNDDNSVVAFRSLDILPPNQKLKAEIQISFEEKTRNTSWRQVKNNMGKVITESGETSFTTGEAPNYIPTENVAYSYPLINQFNFYKGENSRGYIKLKIGQPYLFELDQSWRQEGRFVPVQGQGFAFDFAYDAGQRQINFNINSSAFKNGEVYSMQLVSIPQAKKVDRNVKSKTTNYHETVATVNTEITTKEAEGYIVSSNEEIIFNEYFRTSIYNTFRQKMNSITITSGWSVPDRRTGGPVHELGSTIYADEYFDKAEINGLRDNPSLIQLKADIEDTPWYRDKVYPLVYEGYPFVPGMKIRKRDLELGTPPEYAAYLVQNDENAVVTESNAGSNPVNYASLGKFSLQVDYYMHKDYKDLQTQTANYFVTYPEKLTRRMRYILETPYPVVSQGEYKIHVDYVLPGKSGRNSRRDVLINQPFDYDK